MNKKLGGLEEELVKKGEKRNMNEEVEKEKSNEGEYEGRRGEYGGLEEGCMKN